MSLSYYKPTRLENWINQMYQQDGISSAYDLDIYRIANIFDIVLTPSQSPTHAQWTEHLSMIFLNVDLDEIALRESFFHELCHPLLHVGSQFKLPRSFVDHQEMQAGLFQLYSAMPIYIIQNYEDEMDHSNFVSYMAYEFRLSPSFVVRRMEQIKARIQKGMDEQQIFDSTPRPSKSNIVPHTPETMKMLMKLSWLAAQKGRKINLG